jgi:hypothetical protein
MFATLLRLTRWPVGDELCHCGRRRCTEFQCYGTKPELE